MPVERFRLPPRIPLTYPPVPSIKKPSRCANESEPLIPCIQSLADMPDSGDPQPPRKPGVLTKVGVVLSVPIRAMAMVARGLLPWITYLYQVRVAFITLLIFCLLPLFCWLGPLRPLTIGAFDVNQFIESFAAVIIFVATAGGITSVMETFTAGARKRYPDTRKAAAASLDTWRWLGFAGAMANTVWMLLVSCWGADQDLKVRVISGAVTGFFVSLFIGGGAWTRTALMAPVMRKIAHVSPRTALWLSQRGIVALKIEDFFGLASLLDSLRQQGRSMDGILAPPALGAKPRFVGGVLRALVYAVVLTLLYIIIIVLGNTVKRTIPPISAVYFLLLVCCFIFSTLTFVLDRYRIPLSLVLIVYLGFMTFWREGDHFYAIRKGGQYVPESSTLGGSAVNSMDSRLGQEGHGLGPPARVLKKAVEMARQEGRPDTLVVIALAGGGIQAAAWPVAALEAIEQQIPGFHRSVVLVSGVSGGSVGAMYYIGAYPEPPKAMMSSAAALPVPGSAGFALPALAHRSHAATVSSMTSSLEAVTFAALRDDVLKATVPIVFSLPFGPSVLRDRGLALERSFMLTGQTNGLFTVDPNLPPEVDQYPTLHSWGRDAERGLRPALIMNATVVESGERMAYSTVPCGKATAGSVEFTHRYNADMLIATAARLSATFPAISPPARPIYTEGPLPAWHTGAGLPETKIIPGPNNWDIFPKGGSFHHVVDGGYFDNSGMVGAITWLHEAFEDLGSTPAALPKRIVVIQMSGFPVPPSSTARAVDDGHKSKGTLFDFLSPAQTVIGIRDSVQRAFSHELVQIFQQRWQGLAILGVRTEVIHMRLCPIIDEEEWHASAPKTIGYLPHSPPLSWHLRQCEKDGIMQQVAESLDGSVESLQPRIGPVQTAEALVQAGVPLSLRQAIFLMGTVASSSSASVSPPPSPSSSTTITPTPVKLPPAVTPPAKQQQGS